MCNLGEGLWEKAEAKGKEEGLAKGEEKGITKTASAFTSFMISEFGLSKEEAESKAKEVISGMDKDKTLAM